MLKAIMYYEWLVWFKNGNIIAQHKSDGTEILWREVIDYHRNRSQINRVGWVPFTPRRARDASALYKIQYDEVYEREFEASYQIQVDEFVVPKEPRMDDKSIKYKIKKFEKAMEAYRKARKTPYNREEWRDITYLWKDNCVSKKLPSHFCEPVNGEIPMVIRRLEITPFKRVAKGGKLRYYYILGSAGRKVKDNKGKIHYIEGYYQAIDDNGHTRLCHYSNVPVPIIPPEFADTFTLEVNDID